MRRGVLSWLLAAVCVMLAGCADEAPAPQAAADKVSVFVSILPQEYFVERVGGEHVTVESLVRPGESPHNFSATAAQMTRLGGSSLYFTIGVPFEHAVIAKITDVHKGLKVVDTRRGIALRRMRGVHHHEHEGEHEHEHGDEAGEPDPHTWLNPRNVALMAQHICAALRETDPAHAAQYDKNLAAFVSELEQVDRRIAAALAPLRGRKFMVFHPSFGYFADAYGLEQLAVEVEGKAPSAKAVGHLIESARQEGIRVIFMQPQFSAKRAEMIADEIGGVVVPMDPLARDYLKNLEEVAAKIGAVFAVPEGKAQ